MAVGIEQWNIVMESAMKGRVGKRRCPITKTVIALRANNKALTVLSM